MVKDQYANYVVQKILGVVETTQRDRLIETIRTSVPNLRKIAFGKHIVARVEKLTGKVVLSRTVPPPPLSMPDGRSVVVGDRLINCDRRRRRL